MPFNLEWDPEAEEYISNLFRTGPPQPPETGTTQSETGNIVGDASTIKITPATPVTVTIPGPRERVIDAQGNMTPRWRRFFEELYRRTGHIEDNINVAGRNLSGAGTTGSIAFTGAAPTVEIDHFRMMGLGSLSIAGSIAEPSLSSPVEAPSTGSISIAGAVPVVVIA